MFSSFYSVSRAFCFALAGTLLLTSASLALAAPPGARIRAPELDGGTGWLGTDEPIHLKDLRGKVVVFDFWTLC